MLRHDDVTHKREAVAVAYLAQHLHEDISGANRARQREAPIAGESNEMQMAASIVANEFVGHESSHKSKPRPSKNERVGHPEVLTPEKQRQSLSENVQEWYYLTMRRCQQEKRERVGHPR